jgi:hypothetical protein
MQQTMQQAIISGIEKDRKFEIKIEGEAIF